jgi:hypothetical protein
VVVCNFLCPGLQVNLDYARAMNKIIFDESVRKRPRSHDAMFMPTDEEFPIDPPRPVPQ